MDGLACCVVVLVHERWSPSAVSHKCGVGVQRTPHRTRACAHFSRCALHARLHVWLKIVASLLKIISPLVMSFLNFLRHISSCFLFTCDFTDNTHRLTCATIHIQTTTLRHSAGEGLSWNTIGECAQRTFFTSSKRQLFHSLKGLPACGLSVTIELLLFRNRVRYLADSMLRIRDSSCTVGFNCTCEIRSVTSSSISSPSPHRCFLRRFAVVLLCAWLASPSLHWYVFLHSAALQGV